MSFTARANVPPWPVEDGRTRTTIAGYCVDWVGSQPSEAEVLAAMAPTAEQLLAMLKAAAKAAYAASNEQARLDRAIVVLTVDELNDIRDWIMSFKAAVAGAATLAALKNAVAALPNMPDRTYLQAKNAVENAIDADA